MGRRPDPRTRPGLPGRLVLRARALALALARRRASAARRGLEALVEAVEGARDAAR